MSMKTNGSFQLIAAQLLLTLPSAQAAFTTLSNLLNRPLTLAFLTGDPASTNKAYNLTLSLLAVKYPRLHSHLFGMRSPDPATPLPMGSAVNGQTNLASSPPSQSHSQEVAASSSASSLQLDPALILEPMYRTLFLGPRGGLGLDIAARVWDVVLFDGDTAIIRTAVALLGSLEGKLYGDRASVLKVMGWGG